MMTLEEYLSCADGYAGTYELNDKGELEFKSFNDWVKDEQRTHKEALKNLLKKDVTMIEILSQEHANELTEDYRHHIRGIIRYLIDNREYEFSELQREAEELTQLIIYNEFKRTGVSAYINYCIYQAIWGIFNDIEEKMIGAI